MNAPLSVLMIDGQSNYALAVARCLVSVPGVRLHVLSVNPRALVRYARRISSFELMPSLPDDPSRLDLLRGVVRKRGIDVILACSEEAIGFIAANRAALAKMCAVVAVPGARNLAIANDKWLLSRHVAAHAIRHPDTSLVTAGPEFEQAIDLMKPPLLLKPVARSGGDGMACFATSGELLKHIRQSLPADERCIVQTMVEGRDAGCNVLCRDGNILVSTVQKCVIPSSTRFRAPSCIDLVHDEEVLGEIGRLMASLNWSGVANIDLRLDEENHRVTVLEVNPRYWGSLLGSLYAGVNFPYLACLEGLGIPLPGTGYRHVRFTWHKRKIVAGLLAPRGKSGIESRGSIMRYLIPDPMPGIVNFGQRILGR